MVPSDYIADSAARRHFARQPMPQPAMLPDSWLPVELRFRRIAFRVVS